MVDEAPKIGIVSVNWSLRTLQVEGTGPCFMIDCMLPTKVSNPIGITGYLTGWEIGR